MLLKKRRHPSDAAKLHAVFLYEEILRPILINRKAGTKFKINRDISEAIARHREVAYSTQTFSNFARMHNRVLEAGITRERINKDIFDKIKKGRTSVNYGSPPQPDFLVDLLYTVRKVDERTYSRIKEAIEKYKEHYDFTKYIKEAELLKWNNETTQEKIQKGEQLSAKLIDVVSAKQAQLEVTEADLEKAKQKIKDLEKKNDKLRKDIAALSENFKPEELRKILKDET